MSRIRVYGDTSGFIEIKAPDVAGNTTVEIPEGSFVGQAEYDAEILQINDDVSNLENKVSDVEAIAILGL
jgi:hypothetical protein